MSRIFAVHGVASGIEPARFAYRNISDADAFDRFLGAAGRFVPLEQSLGGLGDALTIDDATAAARDAALLARRHGHAVTLFVNPAQVDSGAPYWFSLLNVLLDRLEGRTCRFENQAYETARRSRIDALRSRVKAALRPGRDDAARVAAVRALAQEWGVGELQLPPHLATLRVTELHALIAAGVQIENHGWSHAHHGSLTREESVDEIERGREWLHVTLGLNTRCFAVPYGDARPLFDPVARDTIWFSVFHGWPPGWLAPAVFNREDLTVRDDEVRGIVGRARAAIRRRIRRR